MPWFGVAGVDKNHKPTISVRASSEAQQTNHMLKSIGIACGGVAFGLPALAVVGAGVALVGVGAGIGYVVGGAKLAAVVGTAIAAV